MSENRIRYECEMIQDLLPLYQDNVCSTSSKKIVEEHVTNCENCRNMLQLLKSTAYEEFLENEKLEFDKDICTFAFVCVLPVGFCRL